MTANVADFAAPQAFGGGRGSERWQLLTANIVGAGCCSSDVAGCHGERLRQRTRVVSSLLLPCFSVPRVVTPRSRVEYAAGALLSLCSSFEQAQRDATVGEEERPGCLYKNLSFVQASMAAWSAGEEA
nr:hypothetical protein Itr_chr13CG17690 [Ipomoea trifida]